MLGLGLRKPPDDDREPKSRQAGLPEPAHKVSRRAGAIFGFVYREPSLLLLVLFACLTAATPFSCISCHLCILFFFSQHYVPVLSYLSKEQIELNRHLRVPRACLVKTAREDCITSHLPPHWYLYQHRDTRLQHSSHTALQHRRRWPLKNRKISHGIAATDVKLRRGRGRRQLSDWLRTRPVEATHRMRLPADHRHAMLHLHKMMMVIALRPGNSNVLVRGPP